jgi:hypothetical protein
MHIRKSAIALTLMFATLLTFSGFAKGQILSREAMVPGTRGPLLKMSPPNPNSGVATCGDYFLFFRKGLVGDADAVLFAFDARTPSGEIFPALPGFYAKSRVVSRSAAGQKVPVLRVLSPTQVEVTLPPEEMRLASCLEDSKSAD